MSKEKSYLISLLTTKAAPVQGINWNKLLRISEYAKTNPLLYSNIKDRLEETDIPSGAFQKLQVAYKINLIRNTLLLEEFGKLNTLLVREGINIILLKGIFLIHTLYKDSPALRRMEDVDILIREKDFKKTDYLLRGQGYQALNDNSQRRTTMYFKFGPDKTTLMPVHLHRHISNISQPIFNLSSNSIDINEIWNYAVNLNGSSNVFVMQPEHALLALCEHGLRHGFSGLMQLYDIHLFLTQYSPILDWVKLTGLAREWGLSIPLYVGIMLSKSFFVGAIPQCFLEKVRPEGTSVIEKLFLRYNLRCDFPSEQMCALLYLAMNKKFSQKLRFIYAAFSSRLNPPQ